MRGGRLIKPGEARPCALKWGFGGDGGSLAREARLPRAMTLNFQQLRFRHQATAATAESVSKGASALRR